MKSFVKSLLSIIGELFLWSGILSLFLLGVGSLFMRVYLSHHNGWVIFFFGFSLVAISLLVARFDRAGRRHILASSLGLFGVFLIGTVFVADWDHLTSGLKWVTTLFLAVPVGFAILHLLSINSKFRLLFPK